METRWLSERDCIVWAEAILGRTEPSRTEPCYRANVNTVLAMLQLFVNQFTTDL